MEEQTRSRKLRVPRPQGKGSLLVLVLVVLLVLTGILFYQNAQSQKKIDQLKNNPQEVTKTEAESLAKKVGQSIQLPSDETPSVATVVDASKLKAQPFFAKAQNGDKVLIYTKARKAYLYNPSSEKVIEVATLNINKQSSPSPAPRN